MKTIKILILSLMIVSCGTRKTNVTKTEEKVKVETETVVKETETTQKESDTNIKETTKTEIDKETNVFTDITEITPQDNTKPASIKLPNGQIIDITNAKYRNEKKTDLSKEKTVSLSKYELLNKDLETALKINETLSKQNLELTNKSNQKQTERFSLSWWWLLWFLLLIPIWFGYRELKKHNVI